MTGRVSKEFVETVDLSTNFGEKQNMMQIFYMLCVDVEKSQGLVKGGEENDTRGIRSIGSNVFVCRCVYDLLD
jgi:hypothetical protein